MHTLSEDGSTLIVGSREYKKANETIAKTIALRWLTVHECGFGFVSRDFSWNQSDVSKSLEAFNDHSNLILTVKCVVMNSSQAAWAAT